MWMPSVQPLRQRGDELSNPGLDAFTDWEAVGRAIRESVLDVIAMHIALVDELDDAGTCDEGLE